MRGSFFVGILIIVIPLLTVLFYGLPPLFELDRAFLTTSTFLFSIFTGFFISQQVSRFNAVRESVTAFDGKLSNIYRTSAHISSELQNAMGERIVRHYTEILNAQQWDLHYNNRSTTLTDLHALLDTYVTEEDVTKLANQSLGSIIKGLEECQGLRKRILALREERIPNEQWLLIGFFALVLLLSVTTLPSQGLLFPAIMKSAFFASVSAVLIILYRLTNLQFSETLMGEISARDVLAIIRGSA
jgi:hypothetical protein